MREIKFKAWDNKLNLIVATDSVSLCINGDICYLDTDGEWVIDLKNRITLLQYTGLKDKNGTEIYEGDIIASQNNKSDTWFVSHHKVVWHDTGFMGKQIGTKGSFIGLEHWTSGENGYIVIGNIYENKELLEDKQ